ncbi:MAG: SoxR reducing system RseC family protein [Treponema sp.]|jgi:sigma-E factor negative regulatory protein RseC|nr:SoxR reducing system RseC family protein [Treponema sp.]
MTGIILTISEDIVTLSPETSAACFGCMRQECKTNARQFTAKNLLGLPLAVGQTVEVQTPKTALFSQGLQTIGSPLAGFLGGFMLVGLFVPFAGEAPRIAGGIGALFITAFITCLVRKRFPQAVMPKVIRICEPLLSACPEP